MFKSVIAGLQPLGFSLRTVQHKSLLFKLLELTNRECYNMPPLLVKTLPGVLRAMMGNRKAVAGSS